MWLFAAVGSEIGSTATGKWCNVIECSLQHFDRLMVLIVQVRVPITVGLVLILSILQVVVQGILNAFCADEFATIFFREFIEQNGAIVFAWIEQSML